MTTESYLWTKLKKMPNSDMTRHEDKLNFGIPDVSFSIPRINGWIELKAFKRWPPRGVVKFHNLQKTQVRFLEKRGKRGGHCYILLIVNRTREAEFLLFHWSKVGYLWKMSQEGMGGISHDVVTGLACFHSVGAIDFKSLAGVIRDNP